MNVGKSHLSGGKPPPSSRRGRANDKSQVGNRHALYGHDSSSIPARFHPSSRIAKIHALPLIVPPQMGYGEEGTPDGSIPPDSAIVRGPVAD